VLNCSTDNCVNAFFSSGTQVFSSLTGKITEASVPLRLLGLNGLTAAAIDAIVYFDNIDQSIDDNTPDRGSLSVHVKPCESATTTAGN
jgi:hypothetical protein